MIRFVLQLVKRPKLKPKQMTSGSLEDFVRRCVEQPHCPGGHCTTPPKLYTINAKHDGFKGTGIDLEMTYHCDCGAEMRYQVIVDTSVVHDPDYKVAPQLTQLVYHQRFDEPYLGTMVGRRFRP